MAIKSKEKSQIHFFKNREILNADPNKIANSDYINALYKEVFGRSATAKELTRFKGNTVKNTANLILGKDKSPYSGGNEIGFQNGEMVVRPKTVSFNADKPGFNSSSWGGEVTHTDSGGTPPPPPPPPPEAAPTQPDFASQIATLLQPTKPIPPTFDQSGLYNETDVNAQAQAEYSPYFSNALADMVKGYGRKNQNLQQEQQQQTGNQLSNYLNRGLSHSGGFLGAQQQLGQQQGLATQDLAGEQTMAQNELAQKKALALEDYKRNAYTRAYSQYLNRNYK